MRGLIQLSSPTETFAFDTTLPQNGAPGLINELRYYNHPTYGLQIYRLTLWESAGTALTQGLLATLGKSTKGVFNAAIALAADAAALIGVVQMAGFSQNSDTVTDDYWCWLLVQGVGLVSQENAPVASAMLLSSGAGQVDDSASNSTAPVGICLVASSGVQVAYVNVL